ncbi:Uncharacterised protein [Cedecea davisae]|nr:Uncharacterised protein [Cedecea davisae]
MVTAVKHLLIFQVLIDDAFRFLFDIFYTQDLRTWMI